MSTQRGGRDSACKCRKYYFPSSRYNYGAKLFQGFSSSWKFAVEWMCFSHRILLYPLIISWSTLMALTRPCRQRQCHGFAKAFAMALFSPPVRTQVCQHIWDAPKLIPLQTSVPLQGHTVSRHTWQPSPGCSGHHRYTLSSQGFSFYTFQILYFFSV